MLSHTVSAWGDRRRRTVGLLGGSFNPAHDGHRYISLIALNHLGLDEVWWLVSPQNPLKSLAEMAPLSERLASAAAVSDHPRIRVTGVETQLATKYTADTLAALKVRYPGIRFVWLMGADNLAQIPKWRRWTDIFRGVPVAIIDRAPYSFSSLAGKAVHRFARWRVGGRAVQGLAHRPPPAWTFLPVRRHDGSATAIRARRRSAAHPSGGHRHT